MDEKMTDTTAMDHIDRRYNMRLDRIEGVVEGLATNQARVESTLTALTNQSQHLTESFEKFTHLQQQAAKTNWGVLLSGITLVLALVIALGTGFIGQPLSQLEVKVERGLEASQSNDIKIRAQIATINEDNTAQHAMVNQINPAQDYKIKYNRDRIHELGKAAKQTEKDGVDREARLSNLERIVFPSAKYRAGKPD